MNEAPSITCPQCSGSGRSDLPKLLWSTLKVVRQQKICTAHAVAKSLRWKGSAAAINARLEDLRALGFVSRERKGKFYHYSPA